MTTCRECGHEVHNSHSSLCTYCIADLNETVIETPEIVALRDRLLR